MRVSDILRVKGGHVLTIERNATVERAIRILVDENVGSLVVVDPPKSTTIVGIITERDILRTVDRKPRELAQLLVEDFMSSTVRTSEATDSLDSVMGLMTSLRIRHMPIVEDGQLCGMISIGDAVKAKHDDLNRENHYLKEYIHQ